MGPNDSDDESEEGKSSEMSASKIQKMVDEKMNERANDSFEQKNAEMQNLEAQQQGENTFRQESTIRQQTSNGLNIQHMNEGFINTMNYDLKRNEKIENSTPGVLK